MALALRKSDDSGPPPGWITCAEAAARLGVTERAIQIKCQGRYEATSLAIQLSGVWYINPVADVMLATGDTRLLHDREAIVALHNQGVPNRYVEQAKDRRDLVLEFLAFDPGDSRIDRHELFINRCLTTKRLPTPHIKKLKPRHLRNLVTAYDAEGITGLVKQRKDSAPKSHIGEQAKVWLTSLMYGGNRFSFPQAYKMTLGHAAKQDDRVGWHVGNLNTVRKEIGKMPKFTRRLADKGPRAARADCIPKMERNIERLAAGDVWVGDTCTVDVQLRYRDKMGEWEATRQAYITAWMDMRSRVIVGYVIKAYGNSNTILAALKNAIRQYGKPLTLLTDWGKDYRAATRPNTDRLTDFDGNRVGTVLDELGIQVQPVTPYLPNAKPIESWFRTFHATIDRMFPSYWSGEPESRHEDRVAWIKHVDRLPHIKEYRKAVEKGIDTYHRNVHTGKGMRDLKPLEAMEAWREGPIRRESDEVLDHFFKKYYGPKQVRRDGIRHNGHWYGWGDHRVMAMHGQKEKVLLAIQPEDASRAVVCKCNSDRTPLFTVECLNFRNLSEREAALMRKDLKKATRPQADFVNAARRTFRGQEALEHIDDLAKGTRLLHGDTDVKQTAHSSFRYRPGLQEPLENLEPAPSDQLDSKAARTGTDDLEVDLIDVAEPVNYRQAHDVDEDMGPSLADILGDDL